jgi:hypothetical protein
MIRTAVVVLACLLAFPSAAVHAEPKTSKAAKVTLDVPKGWKVDVKDDTMRGESGDKQVALLMWVVDSADVDAATKKLDGELYSAVASLKWGKPTAAKVHGLKASYIDGTGRAVSGELDVKVIVVGPTATKKGVILVAAVEHAKLDAHKAEIQALFESVRPAR